MELGKRPEKKDRKIMLRLLGSRREFSPGGRKGSCLMTVDIWKITEDGWPRGRISYM